MPRRLPLLAALLLLAPLLAGCVMEEPLTVALHVGQGQTKTLQGQHAYAGSILVDGGGTLVLDHADVRLQQALVVQGGRLEVRGGTITFAREGGFSRHDLDAGGIEDLDGAQVQGMRQLLVGNGEARIHGGTFTDGSLNVEGGSLSSEGTAWTLRGGQGPAISVGAGSLDLRNGSVTLAEPAMGLHVARGAARLANLTFDASLAQNAAATVESAGSLELDGVILRAPDPTRADSLDVRGALRLLDTPLPQPARPPLVQDDGALTVAWTLIATAVSLPGNAPVPGIALTLYGADAPGVAEANATTDAAGQARFAAVEYVLGAAATRSGNPHALVAEDGGRHGASGAFTVESPASVMVPVVG